jgi:hypothetical protein
MNGDWKEFHLIAEPVEREFAPGMTARLWGYNGQSPGPTIECVEGDKVRIFGTAAASNRRRRVNIVDLLHALIAGGRSHRISRVVVIADAAANDRSVKIGAGEPKVFPRFDCRDVYGDALSRFGQ